MGISQSITQLHLTTKCVRRLLKKAEWDQMMSPKLVISIDVGTTYSGCAMSFAGDKYRIHAYCEPDPTAGEHVHGSTTPRKVPTALLLKPDKTFHSFGVKALHHHNNELDADEQAEWLFFQRFKMKLHTQSDLTRDTEVKAENGRKLSIMSVFAHTMRYFKAAAIEQINKYTTVDVTLDEIHWVLTIPAIWNDGAKQMMREAAREAGLISELYSDKLVIALEPESASLYCKSVPFMSASSSSPSECTSQAYKPGTRYILVDMGGGTVDVAVHEVEKNETLKELHYASGGPWGGTYLDKRFIRLLQHIFGKDNINQFQAEYQSGWVEWITMKFEGAKRMAEPNKTLYVEIPHDFHEFLRDQSSSVKENIKGHGNTNITFSRGSLALKYPEVQKLFEPIFANISTHLKSVLSEVKDVKYMILVGGFATCTLLRAFLKNEFKALRVMNALDCSLAVVMGSVLFGHDPTLISARRAKVTYGIESVGVFDPIHDPETTLVINKDGRKICAKRFMRFVQKNEEIPVGKEIKRSFNPAQADSEQVTITICTSNSLHPRHTTDPEVNVVASMELPMPDTKKGKDRRVDVFMKFGATEIKVRSEDTSSGERVEDKVKVDFLYSH